MKINLKTTCKKDTITRSEGEKINKKIVGAWRKEKKITVDFSNIQIASVSFIDEAFGKLAFKYSLDEMREKMEFKNMDSYDRALLNDIMVSRFRQKDNEGEETDIVKEKPQKIFSKKGRKKAAIK